MYIYLWKYLNLQLRWDNYTKSDLHDECVNMNQIKHHSELWSAYMVKSLESMISETGCQMPCSYVKYYRSQESWHIPSQSSLSLYFNRIQRAWKSFQILLGSCLDSQATALLLKRKYFFTLSSLLLLRLEDAQDSFLEFLFSVSGIF